jgi:hypothetical protein
MDRDGPSTVKLSPGCPTSKKVKQLLDGDGSTDRIERKQVFRPVVLLDPIVRIERVDAALRPCRDAK